MLVWPVTGHKDTGGGETKRNDHNSHGRGRPRLTPAWPVPPAGQPDAVPDRKREGSPIFSSDPRTRRQEGCGSAQAPTAAQRPLVAGCHRRLQGDREGPALSQQPRGPKLARIQGDRRTSPRPAPRPPRAPEHPPMRTIRHNVLPFLTSDLAFGGFWITTESQPRLQDGTSFWCPATRFVCTISMD